MTKEFKYPKGHNWEGLTPKQVSEGYEKKEFNLSEKIQGDHGEGYIPFIHIPDVKEFIKRLKEEPEDFQYKVVNYKPKDLDAWGKKIKYPKKYSWKDIEFAIKLKLEQINKLGGDDLI